MPQDARIVVDLLERHARVPSREEILERYIRMYRGRKIGIAVGGEAAAPGGVTTEPAAEVAAMEGPAPEPETPIQAPVGTPISKTPTREMEALAGTEAPVDREGASDAPSEPAGREEDREDLEPTQMMPAVGIDTPSDDVPGESEDNGSGEDEAGSAEVGSAETFDDRPSGRPGKKKKRKKRRGLGA